MGKITAVVFIAAVLFTNASRGDTLGSECGLLQNSIEERIQDCAKVMIVGNPRISPAEVKWYLVSRKLKAGKNSAWNEAWMDSATGLIWGEAVIYDGGHWSSHYNALRMSPDGTVIEETLCNSDSGKIANLGISEKKFGIPTIHEWERARIDGVREVLPDFIRDHYWSATLSPSLTSYAYVFDGHRGQRPFTSHREDEKFIRCVGR